MYLLQIFMHLRYIRAHVSGCLCVFVSVVCMRMCVVRWVACHAPPMLARVQLDIFSDYMGLDQREELELKHPVPTPPTLHPTTHTAPGSDVHVRLPALAHR